MRQIYFENLLRTDKDIHKTSFVPDVCDIGNNLFPMLLSSETICFRGYYHRKQFVSDVSNTGNTVVSDVIFVYDGGDIGNNFVSSITNIGNKVVSNVCYIGNNLCPMSVTSDMMLFPMLQTSETNISWCQHRKQIVSDVSNIGNNLFPMLAP